MSRTINADLSGVNSLKDLQKLVDAGELDGDDVAYLFGRGQLPDKVMRQLDSAMGFETPDPAERLAQVPNTGTINTVLRGGLDDDELLEEDYTDMSHKSLQAEAKRRDLSSSGTKEELIQRLVEDDVANGGNTSE